MGKQVFEVSWEICNRIGNIYTVLSTKARTAVEKLGENYWVVGPLLERNPGFREEEFDGSAALVKLLAEKAITVKAGRWDVPGSPRCILVNYKTVITDQDRLLYHLWENFGVDSMFGGWDYVEPVLFSTACGLVVAAIAGSIGNKDGVCVHFHEWMTAAGLLHLRKNAPQISTVFTVHSTVLGRRIAGNGGDIYTLMDTVDAMQESKKYGVSAKTSIEAIAARQADCFTAASQPAANEALALLGTNPVLITPNALDTRTIPDYSVNHELFSTRRTFLLDFASRFLKKKFPADSTKILAIAGRYEFQNKGFDVFLESLASLEQQLRANQAANTSILAFVLLQGGHVGANEEAVMRVQQAFQGVESEDVLATHPLTDRHNDPVLNACKRLGLRNNADNRCNVVFVPVTLDGRDGIFNVPYEDVLAGCDLAVLPASYDPSGCTPLLCVAHSVPTIVTDLSGFGERMMEQGGSSLPGIMVLERQGRSADEVRDRLVQLVSQTLSWDEAALWEQKRGARAIAEKTSWEKSYANYEEAYQRAGQTLEERMSGMRKIEEETGAQTSIAPTNSNQPRMRSLSVVSELPAELKDLESLAYSMWWVWNRDAREVFKRLDPAAWDRLNSNPVALLQQLDDSKLNEALENDTYMHLYRTVVQRYKAVTTAGACRIQELKNVTAKNPVAYFSMEFGIHECLPIYSGGLGILSGDHLKSASDLQIPLVGIGLLYKFGYFVQRINRAGDQVPVYEENFFARMPVRPVTDAKGKPVRITVDLPGRQVHAQVWLVQVGTVSLYLMDTDIDDNSQKDRFLTSKLYDSSTRERIEQEVLLGIGGICTLRVLGIEPSVYHLNEGHSAFLLVEQMRLLMKEKGLDFDTAREVVRSRSVFTTHTPVPAGNERFHRSLIENYFRQYVEQAGISWEQFWNLGHVYSGEESDFEMTVLALKMCSRYNGVSRLHGKVAQGMWQHVWRGFLAEEAPIGHVTNGVHCSSWIADEMRNLLETYSGIDIEDALLSQSQWDRIDDIPSSVLWQTHNTLKNRLFELARQTVQGQWTREGEDPSLLEQLRVRINPGAFTIGFARRIATYKRPLLILKDLERLRRLITNQKNPVQILFAGKAHPADREAASLIREIVRISKEPDFLGRLVFLEGYNIRLARALVSGVDLWLNNPIRPMEASGTSGMKAAMNGVINCSVLDGWWDECYAEDALSGWAVGDGSVLENRESQDLLDSENLYDIIEDRIVNAYYTRNARNIPEQWVQHMKHAMMSSLRQYNTHRMLRDYCHAMYQPTAAFSAVMAKNEYSRAKAMGEWKRKLPSRFSTLGLSEVRITGLQGSVLNINNTMSVSASVLAGKMRPNEIAVEIVIQDDAGSVSISPMVLRKNHGSHLQYEGNFEPPRTGQFRYGVRVVPCHQDLVTRFDPAMVCWG